jgi:membrane-associated phospholipid phosphatase
MAYLFFCVLYVVSGRFHFRELNLLPTTTIDNAIPLIHWTLWIYFSHFLFLPVAIYQLKDRANFSGVIYSMILATAFSSAMFLLYPTAIPRAPFQIGGLTNAAAHLLYFVDLPTNCFPSLHVSLSYLAAFGFLHENRKLFPFAFFWATIISASTMTIKQHYFVDVVGGLVVAILCRVLIRKVVIFMEGFPYDSKTLAILNKPSKNVVGQNG